MILMRGTHGCLLVALRQPKCPRYLHIVPHSLHMKLSKERKEEGRTDGKGIVKKKTDGWQHLLVILTI